MNSADKNTEWRAGPLITNDYLKHGKACEM